MANYVNVQKQEYADLQAGLEAIHQKVLAYEESVRTCIDGLMELEGGFYVGQISNKVQEILQSFTTMVSIPLKTNFSNSERAISMFLDAIQNNDVIIR